MEILPVGAEMFHADRQTDMMQLIVTFHNFTNTTKNDVLTEWRNGEIIY
jgi:3-dehydroquinate dehydratase